MKLVAMIFGLVGAIFLAVAFWLFSTTQEFLKIAATAKGTVIEMTVIGDASYPVVRFATNDGKTITFKSSFGSSPPAYRVGDPVEVFYNPQDPHDAKINSWLFLWLLPTIFGGLGGVFAAIAAGMLIYVLKSSLSASAPGLEMKEEEETFSLE